MANTRRRSRRTSQATRDSTAKIIDLRRAVKSFVEVREWDQFHSPKNLSMAIAVEAAELLDIFKWCSPEQSEGLAKSPKMRAAIADELADVFIYELAFVNSIGLDLTQAVLRKLEKNNDKYPIRASKGKYKSYC